MTTIVLVRKNNEVVVAGDGQVSMGNTVVKSTAVLFTTVFPILTCPSPATTTSLFFLTSTIVVIPNKW